jgi:hypothetical protein
MGPLKALIPQKHVSSHLEDTKKGKEKAERWKKDVEGKRRK